MPTPEIKVVADAQSVAITAAERTIAAAEIAIELRGSFSIVLTGGTTPRLLYNLLAAEPARSCLDRTKVQVFFGDERCVPPVDPESNYKMARELLLAKVPVPGDNVYRIRGEASPAEAAQEYDQTLHEYFADSGPDLTLLGMGDDGHTASLFPGTEALHEAKRLCVANFVPGKQQWRLTATPPFLNRSEEVLILVSGSQKAERVAQVLEGPRVPDELPIQLIQSIRGRLAWIMDAAAAGM
jgi:6-phosphogluconolactonase